MIRKIPLYAALTLVGVSGGNLLIRRYLHSEPIPTINGDDRKLVQKVRDRVLPDLDVVVCENRDSSSITIRSDYVPFFKSMPTEVYVPYGFHGTHDAERNVSIVLKTNEVAKKLNFYATMIPIVLYGTYTSANKQLTQSKHAALFTLTIFSIFATKYIIYPSVNRWYINRTPSPS